MPEPVGGGAPRVLIAEDDENTGALLAEQLTNAGFEVVAMARNGREAIALALDLHPDIALLDIQMPERTGLEAAEEIMLREPMAIVMLSGFHDEAFIQRANTIGVFAYLVKPASTETLKTTMGVALRRFEELQAARKEAGDLQEALETRKLVERAKGVLMQRLNLSEPEAFRRLQRTSNNQSKPLKQIAEAVLIMEGLIQPES